MLSPLHFVCVRVRVRVSMHTSFLKYSGALPPGMTKPSYSLTFTSEKLKLMVKLWPLCDSELVNRKEKHCEIREHIPIQCKFDLQDKSREQQS